MPQKSPFAGGPMELLGCMIPTVVLSLVVLGGVLIGIVILF
jgi:hypothetical protein